MSRSKTSEPGRLPTAVSDQLPQGTPETLTLVEPGAQTDDYPDAFRAWGSGSEENGLQVHRFGSTHYFDGTMRTKKALNTRWVSGGAVDEYIANHATEVRTIPSTYTSMDEFSRCLAWAQGNAYRYGYGIDEDHVEIAHRLLTGRGHFDGAAYRLIRCGNYPALLTGPEGTVALTNHLIHRPEKEAERAETEVHLQCASLTVEEDGHAVLQGLRRLAPILDAHYDIALTEHESPPVAGGHSFATASGDTIEIYADNLRTVGLSAPSQSALQGIPSGIINRPHFDENVEVTADVDLPTVGTHKSGAVLVGLNSDWERDYNPRTETTSHRYVVSLHWLSRDTGLGGADFRLRTRERTITTVE